MSNKKLIPFILVLFAALGQFTVDLYLPSLPHMASHLQTTNAIIKLTIPIYLVAVGFAQLFYGPLSDRFGRKPTLHFGLGIYTVGSFLAFVAPNAFLLILARAIQGLGAGAAIVNVRAIIRDAYKGKEMAKVSAFIFMIWTITPIVAPAIGGYIETYLGWRANFICMLLYGGITWGLLTFLLPETLDDEHKKPFHPKKIAFRYREIMTNKVFLAFSALSSLCYGYFISFATASPFLFQDQLGLTPIAFGWIILCIAVGAMIGSLICRLTVKKVTINRIIFMGSIVTITSMVCLVVVSWMGIFTVLSLLLPTALGSIGGGLIFPNCTTGAMTPYKKNAATAGAAFGFIQMFNAFVFTMIISHLSVKTPLPLSIELLVIAILMLVLYVWVIHPHFEEEEEEH